jgi:hypothetical protein
MNSLPQKRSWSVVVSSCDTYSDLWPFFFHFFERHWPRAPRPVYLVSNFLTFDHAGVRTLAIGPDRSWGETMHAALEQIPDDFVVFLLDDFFLDRTIPDGWIDDVVAQLDQAEGDFVSVYHAAAGCTPIAKGSLLAAVHDRDECPGFHAGIFRRSYLMKLASAGEHIWRTESLMRDDLQDRKHKQFRLTEATTFYLTYVESVRGRFWQQEGLDYLKQNNLSPDLWRRPRRPPADDVLSKLIRSLHKRRMDLMDKLRPKSSVKPLQLPRMI